MLVLISDMVKFVTAVLWLMLPCVCAHAVTKNIESVFLGEDVNFYADEVLVFDTGYLAPDNLYFTQDSLIVNRGNVNTNIFVTSGNVLYIENSGTLNVVYNIADTAEIVQVVRDNNDITDVGGMFDVWVRDADSVSLMALINMNTEQIKISNSSLIYNMNSGTPIAGPDVVLDGIVYVKLDANNLATDIPIMSNVSGDGRVVFVTDNLNPIYAIRSSVKDGDIYASLVRETDYSKLLNDDMGVFLNGLRVKNPNDNLLRVLDSATDMDALHNIIRHSARTRPINMMMPIRALNIAGLMTSSKMSGNVSYMFSDTADIYSVGFGVGVCGTDNLVINLSGRIGRMEYADILDVYAGNTIGAMADLRYDDGFIRANFRGGVTIAGFEIGDVYVAGHSEMNPMGVSVFGAIDVGARMDIWSGVYATPFVGMMADSVKIVNSHDTNVDAFIGTDVGFVADDFSINYEYTMRVWSGAGGDFGIGGRIGFVSPWDAIAGGVSYMRMNINNAQWNLLRVDMKYEF